MKHVDFYYSIGSRYSYLAQSQLDRLERDFEVNVRWWPLRSGELMAAAGRTPFLGLPASTQYDPAYRTLDATRWAALYDIPYREPDWASIDFARVNLAAVAAAGQADPEAYSRRLFQRTYGEGARSMTDADLAKLASEVGLDGEMLLKDIDAPETAARHRATIEAARAAGVFGVPSFVIGDALFWGNDRLGLLRHHLARDPAR